MGKNVHSRKLPWPADARGTRIQRYWYERINSVKPGLQLHELAAQLKTSYAKAQR